MKPPKKRSPLRKNASSHKVSQKPKSAYAAAGVNVALSNSLKSDIGKLVKPTHGPEVLGGIGGFGGLFAPNFKERKIKNPVLVASTDGIGTKLKVAFAAQKHDTIGADLVQHCINDILVTGARPLFFLDYLATGKLDRATLPQILKGLSKACQKYQCALIGGETAEMPGIYRIGEYDLAGTIVGVVDRKKILDGSKVRPGDLLVGLPSNGLHTNGYSLARKILFEKKKLSLEAKPPGWNTTVGKELLKIHRCYLPEFELLEEMAPEALHAAAHITGGGFIDNIPRVLPPTCDAVIDLKSWRIPPIFRYLEAEGKVSSAEMFQVFNMGIGMVLILRAQAGAKLNELLGGKIIGRIVPGSGVVQFS